MVDILHTKTAKVKDYSGTTMITVYQDFQKATGLEPGTEIEVGILEGKHGIFLGAWVKGEQPKSETIEEHFEKLNEENSDEVEEP